MEIKCEKNWNIWKGGLKLLLECDGNEYDDDLGWLNILYWDFYICYKTILFWIVSVHRKILLKFW